MRISATGADIVRRDDDAADVHRLVLVRPTGTLLIIESIGLPTVGVVAPLATGQLDELACTLHDPDTDLAAVGRPTRPARVASCGSIS